jgi:hypothetical protein
VTIDIDESDLQMDFDLFRRAFEKYQPSAAILARRQARVPCIATSSSDLPLRGIIALPHASLQCSIGLKRGLAMGNAAQLAHFARGKMRRGLASLGKGASPLAALTPGVFLKNRSWLAVDLGELGDLVHDLTDFVE